MELPHPTHPHHPPLPHQLPMFLQHMANGHGAGGEHSYLGWVQQLQQRQWRASQQHTLGQTIRRPTQTCLGGKGLQVQTVSKASKAQHKIPLHPGTSSDARRRRCWD